MKKQKSDLEKVLNPLLGFYRSGRYMERDDFTLKVIKGLKEGDFLECKKLSEEAIKILKFIKPLIKNYYVVIVPSHDPNNTSPSLLYIAKNMCSSLGLNNGFSFLKRTQLIEKSATTNKRNVSTHLDTIEISQGASLLNKDILLLDDIKTSGASLEACKLILLKNKAKSVLTTCIAETILRTDERTRKSRTDFIENKIKILESISLK